MQNAACFLTELNSLIPPDRGRHSIMLDDNGRLIAIVRHHAIRQKFAFEGGDFQRDPLDLAKEIAVIVKANFAAEEKAS